MVKEVLINYCFVQVQQVVTVAPGTGIGFEEVQHEIQVKEQAVTGDDDKILLHSIKLDRGKAAEYTNEIERPSFETLNQVSVDCSIDGATDDNNVPIRGKYSKRCHVSFQNFLCYDENYNIKMPTSISRFV